MAFWTFQENQKTTTIRVGGETIEIKPLTLENSIRLVLLMGPYISGLEARWPRLASALESTNGKRPKLLETIFMELRQDLTLLPGDLVTAFAICIDRPVEWVAHNATANDLVEAWPVLDAVNDFGQLWAASKHLGIVINYA